METPRLILLPGMHRTSGLFDSFLSTIPDSYRPIVVGYPCNVIVDYDRLLERIESQLQQERSLVIVAESFSGPLAIQFAARHPDQVRALVLCVTFARFPLPASVVSSVRWFASARPPDWFLRMMLAGWDAPQSLIHQLRRVIRKVNPKVIVARVEQVSRIDVRPELSRCNVPILYLGGNQDRIVNSTRRREMEIICPGMRVIKLECSHLLLQTSPKPAWDVISEFLRQLDSREIT